MSTLSCDIISTEGNEEPLPSVCHQGQRYIIAEAGVEFKVRCKLHNATGKDHKVYLSIDGQAVGFSKIFNAQCSRATFEGYLQRQATDSRPSLYRAFKFGSCKPAEDAATVEHPDQIQAGRIELGCDVVIATGRADSDSMLATAVHVDDRASRKKLLEGKKWFLAPGLKAEAGKPVSKNERWSRNIYTTVSSLAPLKLRYDTMENLLLRKILDPQNPAHRAILRTSSNPRMIALGQDPDAAVCRPLAGGSSGSRSVKQERGAAAAGVKRERGEDAAIPRSATAETLDLTGQTPAGPLMIGGRALGANETAVCDLCDHDDEPTWRVHKRQAVDV